MVARQLIHHSNLLILIHSIQKILNKAQTMYICLEVQCMKQDPPGSPYIVSAIEARNGSNLAPPIGGTGAQVPKGRELVTGKILSVQLLRSKMEFFPFLA